MGGSVNTGGQNQNQTSVTTPWAPAAGQVQGLLGQLGTVNTSLTPAEQQALGQLTSLGQQGNQFAPAIGTVANTLLSGGGANNQAGLISSANAQYQQELNPYLQSSFLDPMNTPGFGAALSATNSDITNQINSQFAAAGRDLSGMNTQTLARGLSQGEGQLIANQYNQNVQNQLGAMGSSYNANNTTGGLLTGLNQQALMNEQAGVGVADAANAAQAYGPLLELQAQAQARGIPLQTLAAEMGIALPAGQAFGTPLPVSPPSNEAVKTDKASSLLDPDRIVGWMKGHNCTVETAPKRVNLVYLEGVNPDGSRNDNRIDLWNDIRLIVQYVDGKPKVTFQCIATTEPGTYYDRTHVIGGPQGAALIAPGQQACWQVGIHDAGKSYGHEALVQTGAAVSVYRDFDKSFRRQAGHITTGWYGINQHSTGMADASLGSIGPWSAGCLVAPHMADHKEWMRILKTDERYLADHKFVFPTTVIPVEWQS